MRPTRFLALPAIAIVLTGCQSDSQPFVSEPRVDATGLATTDVGATGPLQNNAATGRGTVTITLLLRQQSSSPVPFAFDHRKFQLGGEGSKASTAQTFTNLKPGSYSLQALAQPNEPFVDIRCTSTGTDNNTVDLANATVGIGLEAGETVECIYLGGWPTGSLVTYDQVAYGDETSAGSTALRSNFDRIFPGGIEIGVIGTAGFSAVFQSAVAVVAFLPQTDPLGTLDADLVNPTSTHAGAFAGEVLALMLNVTLADAGVLGGTASTRIGDLYVCGYSLLPVLNGQTVRQVLATANTLLGGGSASLTVGGANFIASLINGAFIGGSASSFAQTYLYGTPCL
jgi:hypothetical protein